MGDTSNVSDAVKVTDADVRAAAPQLAAAAEQAQKIKSGATPAANPTGAAVNFGSSTGAQAGREMNGAADAAKAVSSSAGLSAAVLNSLKSPGGLTVQENPAKTGAQSGGNMSTLRSLYQDYFNSPEYRGAASGAADTPYSPVGAVTGSANATTVSGNANAAVTNPVSQQVSGNANAANGTVSGNANAAYPNGYQGGYGSYSTTGSGATPTDVNYNNQISKTIAELETLYRDLYGRQREGDFTRTPYYQTIMDQYGIAGDNAANAERAAAAGNNGGNLDSYAAANARRQQLAYRNAAQTAALNAYNAEIGNMLQTLQSLGVNVNDLYGTWSGDLASQRSGANAAYGYDTQRYLSDNDYRAALAGYDRDRYLSNNDLTGTIYKSNTDRYKSDNELLSDRYKSDNELAGKMYGYNTDYDVAALQDATNRYGIDVNYLTSVLGYNTQAAIAQMDADAQMRVAQYQNLLGMYQADIQREIAQGNNASQERINAATLAYNQTRDALNDELQRYLGGLDYQASIANANASVDAARAKANAENAERQAYIDYLTRNGGTNGGGDTTVPPAPPDDTTPELPEKPYVDNSGNLGVDAVALQPYVDDLYRIRIQSTNGTQQGDYQNYINAMRRHGLSEGDIEYVTDAVTNLVRKNLESGKLKGEISTNHPLLGDPASGFSAFDPNNLNPEDRAKVEGYISEYRKMYNDWYLKGGRVGDYVKMRDKLKSELGETVAKYILSQAEQKP